MICGIFYFLYICLFRTIILPIFRENEAKIDKVVNKAVNQGKEKFAELVEKAEKTIDEKQE